MLYAAVSPVSQGLRHRHQNRPNNGGRPSVQSAPTALDPSALLSVSKDEARFCRFYVP